MANFSKLANVFIRRMLNLLLLPILRYLGYRKNSLDLGLPESHYFQGEDALGSMNQIHKRYLCQTGWIESKNANQSIRDGHYIPWTSYAFTHWIDKKNLNKYSILEFGSGASTIYWGKKFGNVYAIESDVDWLRKVSQASAPLQNIKVFNLLNDIPQTVVDNTLKDLRETFEQDLRLFPELDFNFNMINFDLIYDYISKAQYFFVDGGPRNLYMQILAVSVNENAVIFVDNSDQYYTLIGRESLIKHGFKEIEFNSLGPLNHSATSTSVFVKSLDSL
jgi:hypothetical protein